MAAPTTIGPALVDLPPRRSSRGGDQLDRGGEHHAEQLRPGHRHVCRSARRLPASRARVDRPSRAGGSGGSTPTPTTSPPRADPGESRGHLPGGNPAAQHRRAAGHRRVAPAGRHQSAVWTTKGWVQPRPRNGDVEDGYLFVYGHDYAGALRTLAQLTGPAPLLPRNVFGVWYSDYTPYSSSHHRELALSGVRVQQGAPQHALARHRLEGAQRLERLGVEPPPLPRPHAVPGLGARPRHRRDLEHPLEHRRQRPEAGARPNESPGTRLASSELHERELARSGTGAPSPRPSRTSPCSRAFSARGWPFGGSTGVATTRSVSIARRHPRRVDRPSLCPGNDQPGRAWFRPGPHRRLQWRARGGLPGRALVGPHLDHRLHRGRLGHLEHPGDRGGPGARTRRPSASPT